ncbi:MAG: hypothetical protein HY268_07320 [Deltaproteobacteria bacterium]|nr:hypothetical protein [Deltaproteobacteria bacterium]
MVMKKQLLRIVPAVLERAVRIRYDVKELGQTPRLNVEAKNLKSIQEIALQELFSSRESELGWGETEKRIERFSIPDSTGGVNPGDRRAIYHIIRKFKPSAVLEIGTHIGASTVHICGYWRCQ